jgi:hypothetical protein
VNSFLTRNVENWRVPRPILSKALFVTAEEDFRGAEYSEDLI